MLIALIAYFRTSGKRSNGRRRSSRKRYQDVTRIYGTLARKIIMSMIQRNSHYVHQATNDRVSQLVRRLRNTISKRSNNRRSNKRRRQGDSLPRHLPTINAIGFNYFMRQMISILRANRRRRRIMAHPAPSRDRGGSSLYTNKVTRRIMIHLRSTRLTRGHICRAIHYGRKFRSRKMQSREDYAKRGRTNTRRSLRLRVIVIRRLYRRSHRSRRSQGFRSRVRRNISRQTRRRYVLRRSNVIMNRQTNPLRIYAKAHFRKNRGAISSKSGARSNGGSHTKRRMVPTHAALFYRREATFFILRYRALLQVGRGILGARLRTRLLFDIYRFVIRLKTISNISSDDSRMGTDTRIMVTLLSREGVEARLGSLLMGQLVIRRLGTLIMGVKIYALRGHNSGTTIARNVVVNLNTTTRNMYRRKLYRVGVTTINDSMRTTTTVKNVTLTTIRHEGNNSLPLTKILNSDLRNKSSPITIRRANSRITLGTLISMITPTIYRVTNLTLTRVRSNLTSAVRHFILNSPELSILRLNGTLELRRRMSRVTTIYTNKRRMFTYLYMSLLAGVNRVKPLSTNRVIRNLTSFDRRINTMYGSGHTIIRKGTMVSTICSKMERLFLTRTIPIGIYTLRKGGNVQMINGVALSMIVLRLRSIKRVKVVIHKAYRHSNVLGIATTKLLSRLRLGLQIGILLMIYNDDIRDKSVRVLVPYMNDRLIAAQLEATGAYATKDDDKEAETTATDNRNYDYAYDDRGKRGYTAQSLFRGTFSFVRRALGALAGPEGLRGR